MSKGERARYKAGVGKAVGSEAVRARLEALRAWRWSSYPAYVGRVTAPGWLNREPVLGLLGGKRAGRQGAYQRYVEEAVLEGAGESPWGQLQGQTVLGDQEYVAQLQESLQGDGKEQAGLKQLKRRPSWDAVIRVVEEMKRFETGGETGGETWRCGWGEWSVD